MADNDEVLPAPVNTGDFYLNALLRRLDRVIELLQGVADASAADGGAGTGDGQETQLREPVPSPVSGSRTPAGTATRPARDQTRAARAAPRRRRRTEEES